MGKGIGWYFIHYPFYIFRIDEVGEEENLLSFNLREHRLRDEMDIRFKQRKRFFRFFKDESIPEPVMIAGEDIYMFPGFQKFQEKMIERHERISIIRKMIHIISQENDVFFIGISIYEILQFREDLVLVT